MPDLAFSEMEFLRHSKQHPTEMGEEKRLSKSRGKEKRRAERAQNEISEYFKLGAKIRTEVEVPDTLHSVYTNKSGRKLHQGESMNENYQSSYSKSTSQSVDLSKEIFLGLDRRHDFEKLAAMPHSRGKIVQPGVAPNMAMKLSDRDTTYYTWSDSVRSLDVSQSKQKTCSVFSTTPEYIRQMLNDTGIFTNTGIDRNIGRTHKTARKEPVRSKKPTKLLRLSEVPKPISPPMHMQTPSSTKVQSRRAAEARETTLKIHRSSHEVQIRHLDESGSRAKCGWEVLRPAKAIIQHYSPESGWQQHLNDDEAATYSHLSKAKVSGQGISRQVTAQEAYVKHTPTTSGAVRGFDYTKNTTISTRGPEAETSMRHQQQTEQVMYEESSAEMADHRQPLSSGVKQQGGDSCSTGNDGAKCLADPLTNHRQLQSSKAAISDIAAERQVATVLVTDGVPGLSRTLENMPDPPIPYQQAYGAICQVSRTSIVGHVHVAAQAHVSEGLPVRGTQPSRAGGQIFSSHPISSPMIIEPLYKRQLENRISYDLVNQSYNQDVLQDQTLHRFGTPLMEYSHDEGELYDTFEGEYELLNTVENLQEDDGMFSNVADSGARVVEEEEHSPWEMRSRDMSPQAAARQDSYEEAQFAGSSNQRQLPSMDANLSGGGHDRKPSYEPVQELVREEGKEQYNLNRFWRPHRQY